MKIALTCDDLGAHDPCKMEPLLDVLEKFDAPGTFFVAPFWEEIPLDKDPGWAAMCKRMANNGHEIGLHGYKHMPFWEFGPILKTAVAEDPDRVALFERLDRQYLEQGWQVDVLTKKLQTGGDILSHVLDKDVKGFRSPCGSVCPNLYDALDACGFVYDSSIFTDADLGMDSMWRNSTRRDPSEFEVVRAYPEGHRVKEIALSPDYFWMITSDDDQRTQFDLLMKNFERKLKADETFVVLFHFWAMDGPYSRGLDNLERFLDTICAQHGIEFVTLMGLAAA